MRLRQLVGICWNCSLVAVCAEISRAARAKMGLSFDVQFRSGKCLIPVL